MQIKMRPNVKHITVDIIKGALHQASTIVFVCEAAQFVRENDGECISCTNQWLSMLESHHLP